MKPQVSDRLINAIRVLVDLHHTDDEEDLYFESIGAIAAIFPRCLREQLQQLVNGPVWDGDVISKNHRGILFQMGIATRVCAKGEQGYTGARYIGYSILKKLKESDPKPKPTIEELEAILTEPELPVQVQEDGSVQ